MKKQLLALFTVIATLLCNCISEPKDVNYEISLGRVPMTAVWKNGDDTTWSVWGTSMIKDDDGVYHIFYSRWKKELGWSWAVDSEIAHATGSSPYGPWEFSDVTLPRRGMEYWDGWCTHNPTIQRIDGKYYLYYMGNTGDGVTLDTPTKHELNWTHRNNQRIGVAWADSPYGPWHRSDKPLIDVSPDDTAADCLLTNNPSVCQMPDGKILFAYKAVGKKRSLPAGGPVVHLAATAESPLGPVKKYDRLVFHFEGEDFPAEDPYIWYGDGKYRAIVKRMAQTAKGKRPSLMHFESDNGLDWTLAPYSDVSQTEITWEDGKHVDLKHLERPQVYFENGKPLLLLCAADTLDKNNILHSFNVQIPLNINKHKKITMN